MIKSIALLGFVVAGQLSLVHAADQGRLNATDASGDQDVNRHEVDGDARHPLLANAPTQEVERGVIKSEDETRALTTTDGIKTLQTDEDQYRLAVGHGTGLHPTLTNDPLEFQQLLAQNQSMVHVDFSSVSGQSAPFVVESIKEEGVAIYGGLQKPSQMMTARAVTSYQGLPATYWFGDQAESTFVLPNGSVQIVFSQDIEGASMSVAFDEDYKMLLPEQGGVLAFGVTLLDGNGLLVGQQSIAVLSPTPGGPSFLGTLSDIPFRSVIISSTAETWMFSNLNYAVDQEHPMVCGAERPNACKGPDYQKDIPCTGVEAICMGTEN